MSAGNNNYGNSFAFVSSYILFWRDKSIVLTAKNDLSVKGKILSLKKSRFYSSYFIILDFLTVYDFAELWRVLKIFNLIKMRCN